MSGENEFKPGDVVQLNSGGPKMVVDAVTAIGVKVRWFDDEHELHSAQMATAMLTKLPPP